MGIEKLYNKYIYLADIRIHLPLNMVLKILLDFAIQCFSSNHLLLTSIEPIRRTHFEFLLKDYPSIQHLFQLPAKILEILNYIFYVILYVHITHTKVACENF